MDNAFNLADFRRLLAETIAWCRLHTSLDNPKDCLRTPALRPANLHTEPNKWGNFDYDWGTRDENQAVVSALAERRAALLRTANAYSHVVPPNLAGGRLLVASPEESDWCCLSEPETYGFIDDLDVPAWDTWICYLQEPITPEDKPQEAYRAQYNKPRRWNIFRRKNFVDRDFVDWQPPAKVSYLLCWVPPEFLDLTEQGILVNPVECFFWAADYRPQHYNTTTLRELDALGLLR